MLETVRKRLFAGINVHRPSIKLVCFDSCAVGTFTKSENPDGWVVHVGGLGIAGNGDPNFMWDLRGHFMES
jgi:hypothetical protein